MTDNAKFYAKVMAELGITGEWDTIAFNTQREPGEPLVNLAEVISRRLPKDKDTAQVLLYEDDYGLFTYQVMLPFRAAHALATQIIADWTRQQQGQARALREAEELTELIDRAINAPRKSLWDRLFR